MMTVSPGALAARARRHERLVEASGLRRHRRWRGAFVIAAVALVTAAGGLGPAASSTSGAKSSPFATASFPSTPAGKQAKWLFDAVLHHPIPAAQVAAHFDTAYLSTLPAPAATTPQRQLRWHHAPAARRDHNEHARFDRIRRHGQRH